MSHPGPSPGVSDDGGRFGVEEEGEAHKGWSRLSHVPREPKAVLG